MHTQLSTDRLWAALLVWSIVNAVNVLQAIGFLSRVWTGSRAINHLLGHIMIALAVPAGVALVALLHSGASCLHWVGPAVYLAFIVVFLDVDCVGPLEFRSLVRLDILVRYLVLFSGTILLMGLPMFRINWHLWFVTVVTTALLLGSMVVAMRRGGA